MKIDKSCLTITNDKFVKTGTARKIEICRG